MDIIEIRRANLRRWVAENGTPAKEKSLFSQLKSLGSFGEKVARRLEDQYKMGDGFLDRCVESDQAEHQPQAVLSEAVHYDVFTTEERNLVTLYRASTPRGKKVIYSAAERADKARLSGLTRDQQ